MAPKTNPGAKLRQEGTSEDLQRTFVREQQESKAGPPPSVWEGYSNAIPKGSLPWCPGGGGCRSQGASKRENWEALKIETWGNVVQRLRTRCSLNPNFFICHHNRGKVFLNLCFTDEEIEGHLLIWIK